MTIRGKDVVLYLDDSGTMKPVCCARSATLTTTADIGETSTLNTGKWKTFKGLKLSFNLNAAGLVSYDTNLTLATLHNLQFALLPVNFLFTGRDENGNTSDYSGTVLISNIDTPTSYNGNHEYSLQATGSGSLVVTNTIDPAYKIYFGVQDTNANPSDFSQFMVKDSRPGFAVNYGTITAPKYYWAAHAKTAAQKLNWQDENDAGNASTIGGATDLFEVRSITINSIDCWLYITRYKTDFTGYDSRLKFY